MSCKESIYKRVICSCGNSETSEVCGDLICKAGEFGYSEEDIFGIHLAMMEALLNAVKHGNRGDSTKNINIECVINAEKFDVCIKDEGSGFAPDGLPDPRSDENLYKPGGRGVLLMRAYMDVVEYRDNGSCVHMVKYKNG